MNLSITPTRNLIYLALAILISVGSFNAVHANTYANIFNQPGNPDAGFTITENTTIDQAISIWGNVTVKSGATLTVNGKFTLSSATLTIEAGATVIVNNTLQIDGGSLVLSGGRITVLTLSINNANRVSGNGGIKIINSYQNQSSSGWQGQSLTSSNQIKVCYSSSPYFGSAVQTCSDPLFDQVLPIKIVKNSFRLNKIVRKDQ